MIHSVVEFRALKGSGSTVAIKVNFRCIGCGVCSHIAPKTFCLDDARGISIVLNQAVTEEAKKAEESCPVNAIKIDLPRVASE